MKKSPPKPGQSGHNVVPMHDEPSATGPEIFVAAGSPDDPRMQEAMQLMESFMAIEDAESRAALIMLAERLVSYDWVRKAQQR